MKFFYNMIYVYTATRYTAAAFWTHCQICWVWLAYIWRLAHICRPPLHTYILLYRILYSSQHTARKRRNGKISRITYRICAAKIEFHSRPNCLTEIYYVDNPTSLPNLLAHSCSMCSRNDLLSLV